MSEPLTQEEFTPAPKDFGDGWLTKSAQDLCKIAITFGGFRASELVLAIHEIHRGDGLANVTTVTNALQNLYDARREEIAEPGDPAPGDPNPEADKVIATFINKIQA